MVQKQHRSRTYGILLTVIAVTVVYGTFRVMPRVQAVENTSFSMSEQYVDQIFPLLQQYCSDCHSGEHAEGEFDIEKYTSLEIVKQHTHDWINIRGMLESRQMPPKDSPQPTPDELNLLNQWVRSHLKEEAKVFAGDPGPVVLRRLNNAEYTYTLRDLTGVETLNPAEEFPVDGAAGEGFTNTGNALVISPSLFTKYLDAARDVSEHAVLLDEGFRFSPGKSRQDWTNESLTKIREFYRPYVEKKEGDRRVLQEIVVETNQDGRLPLKKYLHATLIARDQLLSKEVSVDEVAHQHGLSSKYLGILWEALNSSSPSFIMTPLRESWKAATPETVDQLVADIETLQKGLWKFNPVGYITGFNSSQKWMNPVSPIQPEMEFRLPIEADSSQQSHVISLVASDLGDGREFDFVEWKNPEIQFSGGQRIPVAQLTAVADQLEKAQSRVIHEIAGSLKAAEQLLSSPVSVSREELAAQQGVSTASFEIWTKLLGIHNEQKAVVTNHLTNQMSHVSNYASLNGWGSEATPLVVANSSAQSYTIPGTVPAHGVVVHPSPDLNVAVTWQSPVTSSVTVEAEISHTHHACGNGVVWALQVQRDGQRFQLANGKSHQNQKSIVAPIKHLSVEPGDLISLIISAGERDHSCDLTAIELIVLNENETDQRWSLSQDLTSQIQTENPLADRYENKAVWHFHTEEAASSPRLLTVPEGSLPARWLFTKNSEEKRTLESQLQSLLTSPSQPDGLNAGDVALYESITSATGPLFDLIYTDLTLDSNQFETTSEPAITRIDRSSPTRQPTTAGIRADGTSGERTSLYAHAPAVIEITLPSRLVAGAEFIVTGQLDSEKGTEGAVQLLVQNGRLPSLENEPQPTLSRDLPGEGFWVEGAPHQLDTTPLIAAAGTKSRGRLNKDLKEFRDLFPPFLCYTEIVPVDQVVTLIMYYREDDHLMRLMLNDDQKQELEQHWNDLRYISQDSIKVVDALEQLIEYTTQDGDPSHFTPLREPFNKRAERFQQQLIASEPSHLQALLEFADRAWRRPLTEEEKQSLLTFYQQLRTDELPHDEAFRMTLARVLISPVFLYRLEVPPEGAQPGPVNDWELATRLSYFLWSSLPDQELRQLADAGQLHQPEVLQTQAARLLKDPKARRLATEFASQWLHIYEFDQLDEKSERHFPEFVDHRELLYEESIQFFTDLFQNNRSVLSILNADYAFLNEQLANYYQIPGVSGDHWRRVDGVREYHRGGILGLGATLAKHSGASRTSPILRGIWVSESLLGERLPKPPPDVPLLPEEESELAGLTVRQLVERHSSDPKCAICHASVDPMGFSLEAFDAIGRFREIDTNGHPIEDDVFTPDGEEFVGIEGLRNYLLTTRRPAFIHQFSRKLLGYSLGRAVQLSDEPLLDEMAMALETHDYEMNVIIEAILNSPQFREIRGRDAEMVD